VDGFPVHAFNVNMTTRDIMLAHIPY